MRNGSKLFWIRGQFEPKTVSKRPVYLRKENNTLGGIVAEKLQRFFLLSAIHRQPSYAYMQFAVIYTSFAVMGYKALQGVTWRYIFY
jgi:hypothetical protein